MTGPEIRPLAWKAAERSDPIEVLTRSGLLRRFPEVHFEAVERLQFHLLIIGQSGVGAHEVDFVETEVRPRRVLHLEPGQVHRWRPTPDFEATIVLIRESPVGIGARWGVGPSSFDLTKAEAVAVHQILDLTRDELGAQRSPLARQLALRALRDLLFVRLGLDQDRRDVEQLSPAYQAFRGDLEADLSVASTMSVRAERIGYSARTISRACLDVTGRTAKQLADERIVLEAKRMLSQPGTTSAQVALAIGFTEPTNFAKFFRRHTSLTPTAWVDSTTA